jgi:hypothetical protein
VRELVREEEFDELKTRVERLEKLVTPSGIGELYADYAKERKRRGDPAFQ